MFSFYKKKSISCSKETKIAVFHTQNNGWFFWGKAGILKREIALYRALQKLNVRTSFVTYQIEDYSLENDLHFKCCLIPKILRNRLLKHLIPCYLGFFLRDVDLIKSNQTWGSALALTCAKFYKKPFIARFGYVWSEFEKHKFGENSKEHKRAQALEFHVFSEADHLIVTTQEMVDHVKRTSPGAELKTTIIPNYVDLKTFSFSPLENRSDRVLFIGRIAEQKNVRTLLNAVCGTNIELTIIGKGPELSELKNNYCNLGSQVEWIDCLQTEQIAAKMRSAKVFILPSHYEGHPKTLIEAMASGCCVIGANRPGIREIIEEGMNGLLCEVDAESIRSTIKRALGDSNLMHHCSVNALKYVEERYSLEKIVLLEKSVYQKAIHESK